MLAEQEGESFACATCAGAANTNEASVSSLDSGNGAPFAAPVSTKGTLQINNQRQSSDKITDSKRASIAAN